MEEVGVSAGASARGRLIGEEIRYLKNWRDLLVTSSYMNLDS